MRKPYVGPYETDFVSPRVNTIEPITGASVSNVDNSVVLSNEEIGKGNLLRKRVFSAMGEAGVGNTQIAREHMGSIDSQPVRELVEDLLEGGKDAF